MTELARRTNICELLRALAMRNRMFIELLLLLMPKVRFREVDTVLAVIERQPKHSLLG